jgi:hypothetical protein
MQLLAAVRGRTAQGDTTAADRLLGKSGKFLDISILQSLCKPQGRNTESMLEASVGASGCHSSLAEKIRGALDL